MSSDQTMSTEMTANKKLSFTSFLSHKALVVILSSNFFGKSHILDKLNNLIGRSSNCDLSINDPRVSKEHCVIRIDEEANFMIEDLNSINHTFINGKKIKKKTKLFYGDKIIIGNTILRFFFEENIEKK